MWTGIAGGGVFALAGLSLGAQIAVEALTLRNGIARYAVLESALVRPMRALTAALPPAYRLCYGLIRRRWFARAQARALGLPEGMLERYYLDSLRFSLTTLTNIAVSNGSYALKPAFSGVRAKVLVAVGEREIGAMRASARRLREAVPGSRLYVAKGMRHGELSLIPIQNMKDSSCRVFSLRTVSLCARRSAATPRSGSLFRIENPSALWNHSCFSLV